MAEYAARAERLRASERERLLDAFDNAMSKIPIRPAVVAKREIAAIRTARRTGGRRTRSE